jgi:hypothetical protein
MHIFDQGILYFRNATPFQSTSANVRSFWFTTKTRPSCAQQRFVQQPCIQFHKSRPTKVNIYLSNYLLTYLLITCSGEHLEKLTGSQLVKKFPTNYGTRRFITAFISTCDPFLSWARSIHATHLRPTYSRSILILSYHLRLGLPSGIFPSGFLTTTLYMPLLYPVRATCLTHLILLDFITRTILDEQYRTLSSTLCSFLHSPVTSPPPPGPNILLSICS